MNEEGDTEHKEGAPSVQETSSVERSAPQVATIATQSVPGSKTRTPCKYFLSKRGCAYGSDCKFLHVPVPDSAPTLPAESKDEGVKEKEGAKAHKSRRPVCRHYLSSPSGCRYGDKCRYRHPTGEDTRRNEEENVEQPLSKDLGSTTLSSHGDEAREGRPYSTLPEHQRSPPAPEEPAAAVLSLASFPGLGSAVAGHTLTVQQPAVVPPSHPQTSHPHNSHKPHSSHNKRHAPTELSLGVFMTTPTGGARPNPPVTRPQRNKNKTNTELRQAELEQLETRFQGNHRMVEKGRERCVYLLTFAPTDPDWNFPFKTVELEVTFPRDYPALPLTARLPDDQGLHSAYINHGNQAISHYLATTPGGSGECTFRPFLHWLDKTITCVFKDAAKQVVAAELFDDETTPTEDHTPYSSEEEDEEGSKSSDTEDDQSDEESEVQQLPLFMTTEKRGTEIRLSGLVMSDGVGVGRCASVKVTLQCTRCRAKQDEIIRAESPASQLCSQCQHCFSFSYRPVMFHSASSALGFLDLQGCLPVDLILMQCQTTLSCLECGRDNTTSGLNYGEHRDIWCKRCHMKLSLYIEQCRFIQHQPGATVLPSTAPLTKKSAKKREALIQVGKPLPEFGTCVHYKKSHRWLRFPCCGKPYPCDTCHDEAEDHVMERANRMICGFCSREQTYSSTQPCVGCGGELVGGRAGAYWEGGKGCRNKTKMSRNDIRKYTNSVNKTQCKKQERVGRQATTGSM